MRVTKSSYVLIIRWLAGWQVRWIRAMYTDFTTFKNDQELLISATDDTQTFDYVEGFVVVNDGNVLNGWGSVPFAPGQISAAMIPPQAGKVLYYLEVTKTYTAEDLHTLDQVKYSQPPSSPTEQFNPSSKHHQFINQSIHPSIHPFIPW